MRCSINAKISEEPKEIPSMLDWFSSFIVHYEQVNNQELKKIGQEVQPGTNYWELLGFNRISDGYKNMFRRIAESLKNLNWKKLLFTDYTSLFSVGDKLQQFVKGIGKTGTLAAKLFSEVLSSLIAFLKKLYNNLFPPGSKLEATAEAVAIQSDILDIENVKKGTDELNNPGLFNRMVNMASSAAQYIKNYTTSTLLSVLKFFVDAVRDVSSYLYEMVTELLSNCRQSLENSCNAMYSFYQTGSNTININSDIGISKASTDQVLCRVVAQTKTVYNFIFSVLGSLVNTKNGKLAQKTLHRCRKNVLTFVSDKMEDWLKVLAPEEVTPSSFKFTRDLLSNVNSGWRNFWGNNSPSTKRVNAFITHFIKWTKTILSSNDDYAILDCLFKFAGPALNDLTQDAKFDNLMAKDHFKKDLVRSFTKQKTGITKREALSIIDTIEYSKYSDLLSVSTCSDSLQAEKISKEIKDVIASVNPTLSEEINYLLDKLQNAQSKYQFSSTEDKLLALNIESLPNHSQSITSLYMAQELFSVVSLDIVDSLSDEQLSSYLDNLNDLYGTTFGVDSLAGFFKDVYLPSLSKRIDFLLVLLTLRQAAIHLYTVSNDETLIPDIEENNISDNASQFIKEQWKKRCKQTLYKAPAVFSPLSKICTDVTVPILQTYLEYIPQSFSKFETEKMSINANIGAKAPPSKKKNADLAPSSSSIKKPTRKNTAKLPPSIQKSRKDTNFSQENSSSVSTDIEGDIEDSDSDSSSEDERVGQEDFSNVIPGDIELYSSSSDSESEDESDGGNATTTDEKSDSEDESESESEKEIKKEKQIENMSDNDKGKRPFVSGDMEFSDEESEEEEEDGALFPISYSDNGDSEVEEPPTVLPPYFSYLSNSGSSSDFDENRMSEEEFNNLINGGFDSSVPNMSQSDNFVVDVPDFLVPEVENTNTEPRPGVDTGVFGPDEVDETIPAPSQVFPPDIGLEEIPSNISETNQTTEEAQREMLMAMEGRNFGLASIPPDTQVIGDVVTVTDPIPNITEMQYIQQYQRILAFKRKVESKEALMKKVTTAITNGGRLLLLAYWFWPVIKALLTGNVAFLMEYTVTETQNQAVNLLIGSSGSWVQKVSRELGLNVKASIAAGKTTPEALANDLFNRLPKDVISLPNRLYISESINDPILRSIVLDAFDSDPDSIRTKNGVFYSKHNPSERFNNIVTYRLTPNVKTNIIDNIKTQLESDMSARSQAQTSSVITSLVDENSTFRSFRDSTLLAYTTSFITNSLSVVANTAYSLATYLLISKSIEFAGKLITQVLNYRIFNNIKGDNGESRDEISSYLLNINNNIDATVTDISRSTGKPEANIREEIEALTNWNERFSVSHLSIEALDTIGKFSGNLVTKSNEVIIGILTGAYSRKAIWEGTKASAKFAKLVLIENFWKVLTLTGMFVIYHVGPRHIIGLAVSYILEAIMSALPSFSLGSAVSVVTSFF